MLTTKNTAAAATGGGNSILIGSFRLVGREMTKKSAIGALAYKQGPRRLFSAEVIIRTCYFPEK